ncbi:MAG TPA: DUF1844 domain-containing protein [Tepidisphaeraceae bacterium]|nr:DUF1844 domain-containing protein [Tepidisphaeraceae bacterium]
MADDKPSLHIDLDWKKQAQEEKRRLEEEEKRRADEAAKRAAEAAKPVAPTPSVEEEALAGMAPPTAPAARGARGQREIPEASLQTLVNTLVTQAMLYMGEMPTASGQTVMSLDMSKHQIDTLGVIEEKTRGNLTEEEQQALDLALYEVRTRFIGVAQQIIAGAA